jgi:hypothetical protein
MLLSIKNNWAKAATRHAAYADDRLTWGKLYFAARAQLEAAVMALLDDLLSAATAAEFRQMLDAVAAAHKGAVAPGLPAPLAQAAQSALARAITLLPAGTGPDAFTRHVKQELADHGNSRSTPEQTRTRLRAYHQAHAARDTVDPFTSRFLDAHCTGIGTMDLQQMEAAAAAFDTVRLRQVQRSQRGPLERP